MAEIRKGRHQGSARGLWSGRWQYWRAPTAAGAAFSPGMIIDNVAVGEEIGMIDSNRPNPNLLTFRQGSCARLPQVWAAATRASHATTAVPTLCSDRSWSSSGFTMRCSATSSSASRCIGSIFSREPWPGIPWSRTGSPARAGSCAGAASP